MQRTSNGVEFSEVGLSSRMTDIHAAVGLAQLDRFEDIVAGRARAAQVYREALQGVAGVVESPQIWSDNRVYQGLVLLLDPSVDRDRTVRHLRENKIESTIGTYAIHRQLPIARHCRVASGGLAGSLSAFRSSITLPLWPDMPSAAIDRVVETLKQVLVS
jgi:dTDP-4-amino-4,6-dideoxygalactose transaminase